jgi:hypothetical protein
MAKIIDFFRKIKKIAHRDALSSASAEDLRNAFKARYHNFQLLLSANNKTLELMSEMEQALHGNQPFSSLPTNTKTCTNAFGSYRSRSILFFPRKSRPRGST